jgi:hypothetical protein
MKGIDSDQQNESSVKAAEAGEHSSFGWVGYKGLSFLDGAIFWWQLSQIAAAQDFALNCHRQHSHRAKYY